MTSHAEINHSDYTLLVATLLARGGEVTVHPHDLDTAANYQVTVWQAGERISLRVSHRELEGGAA
tara:strand:+ start:14585 stop:14779 length:195 start_codon:yes stop_codon:yes gene_type:complete